jgi:hypothetical protein
MKLRQGTFSNVAHLNQMQCVIGGASRASVQGATMCKNSILGRERLSASPLHLLVLRLADLPLTQEPTPCNEG